MALEKAVLLNTATRDIVRVQFNPEEYSLEGGNQFAEYQIVGAPVPPLQYVRGSGRTLRLELFFDTTNDQADVRTKSNRIVALLDKDPTTLAPPVLVFSWGGLTLPCVLDKVGQRFTQFQPNGIPQRAFLSVTLREYVAPSVSIQAGVFALPPTVQSMFSGETLAQFAARVLGDPSEWRRIAELNNIDNPRTLDNRTSLVVPEKTS